MPEGQSSGENLALLGGSKLTIHTAVFQFCFDPLPNFFGVRWVDVDADRSMAGAQCGQCSRLGAAETIENHAILRARNENIAAGKLLWHHRTMAATVGRMVVHTDPAFFPSNLATHGRRTSSIRDVPL